MLLSLECVNWPFGQKNWLFPKTKHLKITFFGGLVSGLLDFGRQTVDTTSPSGLPLMTVQTTSCGRSVASKLSAHLCATFFSPRDTETGEKVIFWVKPSIPENLSWLPTLGVVEVFFFSHILYCIVVCGFWFGDIHSDFWQKIWHWCLRAGHILTKLLPQIISVPVHANTPGPSLRQNNSTSVSEVFQPHTIWLFLYSFSPKAPITI